MKKVILLTLMVLSLTACGQHETVVYQQPVQQVEQPIMVENPDPMSGVLTGMAIGYMMSNGTRYNGHNGYYDNHYHGPSRTIVRHTTVINNTRINNLRTPSNNSLRSVPTPMVRLGNSGNTPVKTGFSSRPSYSQSSRPSFSSRPSSTRSSSGFSSRSRRR